MSQTFNSLVGSESPKYLGILFLNKSFCFDFSVKHFNFFEAWFYIEIMQPFLMFLKSFEQALLLIKQKIK